MRDGYYTLTINRYAVGTSVKEEVHEFFEGILIKIYEVLGNGKVLEHTM